MNNPFPFILPNEPNALEKPEINSGFVQTTSWKFHKLSWRVLGKGDFLQEKMQKIVLLSESCKMHFI